MAIIDRYAGLVVDLDGVVFRGEDLIRGAGSFLRKGRRARPPTVYVTNNSARTPQEWAELFERQKVEVAPEQVVTSAAATADLVGSHGQVYVLGEFGLRETLRAAGAVVVEDAADADTVVVGLDRNVTYEQLSAAAQAIDRGARFVATNPDATLPVAEGRIPGTGAMLAFLRTATDVAPEIVGKPMTGLFELAGELLDVDGPILAVGDQLATDIACARAMGWDSALVHSGVAGWQDLVTATATPTWVLDDLSDLDGPEPPVVRHARESDLTGIRSLLERAEMDADGAAVRLQATLVAEAEGEVVGTAAWELVDSAAHLRAITVSQEHRRFGTGSHLVARALQELRDNGVEWAYLLTPGADELFEKLGFWRVHRDRVPESILATAQYGGPADGAIALVRRLRA